MCLSPTPLSPRFEFGCTGPGPPQKKIYEPFTVGIATLAATLHHPSGRFGAGAGRLRAKAALRTSGELLWALPRCDAGRCHHLCHHRTIACPDRGSIVRSEE